MAQETVPLIIVGHTFGVLQNHRNVAGLYVLATGAGWHDRVPKRWKGRSPGEMPGLGEDLSSRFKTAGQPDGAGS
ncbi:MAG: hypothetical protein JO171_11455 [Paludibacterium sp.]|uniref:hypothetical protein n=1 Tax=Paludibacterium sp. TaxID=1917523 RepID=UPI0025F7967B|nr:hypothetical protein [Paludibacterium sp.]MBV8047764.1 hypothetical protein [Paludibacterium sp.]MBV8648756.1 hypothetical protein [Paludibacterium sp.]